MNIFVKMGEIIFKMFAVFLMILVLFVEHFSLPKRDNSF